MKLLDEKGLTTVWAAIKNTFTSKSDADGKYAEKSKALGSINFDYTAWGLNMSTYNVDGDGCGYINIISATSKTAGVMTASDKAKLDGIAENANNYSLPLAATSTRGGIQLGYSQNGRNYPVQLSGEKAYVNVPWTDTNTTYDLSSYSQKDETVKNISNSMLGTSTSGYKQILEIDYANGTTKNVEISNASGGQNGFMSASDKNKLDNIAAGANNYTLPIASDTVLGGIKTGYNKTPTGNRFPVELDNKGNAYTTIGGLLAVSGALKHLVLENGSYKTVYETNIQQINTDSNTIYTYSFPKKGGTLALTSDIPNVSDLCKLNFVDSPSNCVEGRINMFITTSRDISLNNIVDYGEGLILLLGCYSDSQYTIYCTDSDLYYKENLVDGGYKEYITRGVMFLVTINGSSVYIYLLQ